MRWDLFLAFMGGAAWGAFCALLAIGLSGWRR
jgi:hypothetical protein